MNQTQTKKFQRALNRYVGEEKEIDIVSKPFNEKRFDKVNYTREKLIKYYKAQKPLIVTGVFNNMPDEERMVFVDIKPYIRHRKRQTLPNLCDHINIFIADAMQLCNPLPIPEKNSVWHMVCEVRKYRSQYNEVRYTLVLSNKLGIVPLFEDENLLKGVSKDRYIEVVCATVNRAFAKGSPKKKEKTKKKKLSVAKMETLLEKGNEDFVLE